MTAQLPVQYVEDGLVIVLDRRHTRSLVRALRSYESSLLQDGRLDLADELGEMWKSFHLHVDLIEEVEDILESHEANESVQSDQQPWSVARLVAVTGLTKRTVNRRCAEGKLRATKVGGEWRVDHATAVGFVEDCKRSAAEQDPIRTSTMRPESGHFATPHYPSR